MGEVLGLVANVFAVASLTIQLGDSLRKACEFWESIEDAALDICRISMDLRLLEDMTHSIHEEKTVGAMGRAQERLASQVLEQAKNDIDKLGTLVSGLAIAIYPEQRKMSRQWGMVRIVLKEKKTARVKGYIDNARSALFIFQQSRKL